MNNQKYYIIAVSHKTCGLFAILKNTIAHILYALEQGYIPVVDLKHYQNQYFKDNRTFQDNTWDYFFEQPFNIRLEDIPSDADVIISDNVLIPDYDYALFPYHLPVEGESEDVQIIKLKNNYKKYFRINPQTMRYLEDSYKNLLGDEKSVLGILCRGTDYLSLKPQWHPIQPNPEDVLKKAKELYQKHNYKKIYLATEDKKIYDMFKREFGNILVDNNQYRYSDTENKYLTDITVNRENHNYNLAKEYFQSVYILSKCKYFIGGRTSGTIAAWLMSEGWEYNYIWELGNYGVEEVAMNDKNLLKTIFSIKNEYKNDIKHKVITILGTKFKIRCTSGGGQKSLSPSWVLPCLNYGGVL